MRRTWTKNSLAARSIPSRRSSGTPCPDTIAKPVSVIASFQRAAVVARASSSPGRRSTHAEMSTMGIAGDCAMADRRT